MEERNGTELDDLQMGNLQVIESNDDEISTTSERVNAVRNGVIISVQTNACPPD